MKKTLFLCGLLLLFAGGFFVCVRPAGAVTAATVPNPAILSDISGQFMSGQKFWFDGEYYRFSFTADRDFYTAWKHYGDQIAKFTYYTAYLDASYLFASGPSGSQGAFFVDSLRDLDNYKSGDNIFFLWEKGKHYDTYMVENSIAPSGITYDNLYLSYYLKDYPGATLVASSSQVKFTARYADEINSSHPAASFDKDYSLPSAKPDPVILIPGILGSWQVNGKWEVDPILHTYDNLWEALKAAGYTEGKDLFALPYQWRDSNTITAEKLREKINEVKAICHCDKVDLIGHSMGGLVARAYIEGDNYQGDVNQVIFLATPQRGAPGAYLMWEGGSTGVDQSNWLMDRVFALEAEFNGYGYVSKYLREKPVKSVQELLPVYDYLRDKDSGIIRTYPNNYPRNIFLENLNSSTSLSKLAGVKILNILGDKGDGSTLDIMRVVPKDDVFGDWQNGYPENYYQLFTDHGLEYGPGDNTVPEKSNKDFANSGNLVINNSNHKGIVTDAQKAVIKELTGKEPATEIRNSYVNNLLMVRIFSPADFQVIAPDGKIVGTDFNSSSTINEIAGAYYINSSGSPEFAIIPNPQAGEYRVKLLGTGNGSYRLSMSYIDDNKDLDKDFIGNITVGRQQDFRINYSVSGTLDELKPQDNVPPVISIISPTSSQSYFRNQKLSINYTAVDDFSGIATTTVKINNKEITTSTVDLAVYPVGNYQLSVTAADKAGNIASATAKFAIITDLPHTIADLGYLDKEARNKLLPPLEQLQRELKLSDAVIVLAQKARDAINNNIKLKPAIKAVLLKEADKGIARLKSSRQELIASKLNNFDKQLDNLLHQSKTSQLIYDILKADSSCLRSNL